MGVLGWKKQKGYGDADEKHPNGDAARSAVAGSASASGSDRTLCLIPQHLSAPAVRVQQYTYQHISSTLMPPRLGKGRSSQPRPRTTTGSNPNSCRRRGTTRGTNTRVRLGPGIFVLSCEQRKDTGLRPPGWGGRGIRACGCTCVLLWVAPAGGTSVGSSRLLKRIGDREFLSGLEVCWGTPAQGPVKGEVGVTSWFSHRGALRWGRRHCEHRTRCHASSGSLRPHSTNYGYRGTNYPSNGP